MGPADDRGGDAAGRQPAAARRSFSVGRRVANRPGPYLRGFALAPAEEWPTGEGFPFDVEAVAALPGLDLSAPVTLLAGENGTGKSTITEIVADAMAFAPEGGELVRSMALPPKPRPTLRRPPVDGELEGSPILWPELTGAAPVGGYFLRAESFFNVAEFVDAGQDDPELAHAPDLSLYGGTALHEQSHGQSFMALAANRFGPRGFYVLDEPEAALSLSGCLALLAIVTRAARGGAQFLIATHSPVLMAIPDAAIYELSDRGIERCAWDALDVVRDWRAFLDAPERFVDAALEGLDEDGPAA